MQNSCGISKKGCIFAATYLPRFPSDQRAQGKSFFLYYHGVHQRAAAVRRADKTPEKQRIVLCRRNESIAHAATRQFFPTAVEEDSLKNWSSQLEAAPLHISLR